MQRSTLHSPTGAALALYTHEAETPARAVLLIHHGLAEHAGRYAPFAAFMAARGLHVLAHDHRGHGLTTAADAPQGSFTGVARDGVEKVLADARAVLDHAVAAFPGLPVFLLGHSMGGLIALNFAEANPQALQGLAVWNSNFAAGASGKAATAILAVERMLLGSDVPSRLLPKLTFAAWGKAIRNRRTDFDWLSNDPQAVEAYIADPLCGFDANVGLWQDLFRLIDAGASGAALQRLPKSLPIHLVGGSEDPATDGGKAVTWLVRRMRAAGLADITGRIYQGARHETLNDRIGPEAMADFSAWIDRVLTVRRQAG